MCVQGPLDSNARVKVVKVAVRALTPRLYAQEALGRLSHSVCYWVLLSKGCLKSMFRDRKWRKKV